MPRTLRIALVAPLVTPIGPPFLEGAQALLHDLALKLAGRGHRVTLFAASGSRFEEAIEDKLAKQLSVVEVPVEPGELSPADFQSRGAGEAGLEQAFFPQGGLLLQTFVDLNKDGHPFGIAHAHAFEWPALALSPLSAV